MTMAGPIVMGSMSFVAMDFADKYMVAQLGTEPLAAIGSASIWSYILASVILGIVGCISTFVSQSVGRKEAHNAGSYAWQGFYISLSAGALSLAIWPLSAPLFGLMGHAETTTQMEVAYFDIRLLGYMPFAWATALSAFFQAINRPAVPMYVTLFANVINIFLNYALIYGHFGMPAMGIAGAAWGTILSQFAQAAVLQVWFLLPQYDGPYRTRSTWRFHPHRFGELIRIGAPAGACQLLDVATWGIFISFIVGRFGDAALAANNAALSIMHVSFIPAIALNQAIAPIVGQWIGRGDIPRAKARTYTAIKLCGMYMTVMGIFFAIFGEPFIRLFNDDPEIISLGWSLLIVAAIFQFSDSTNIVLMGALRGAGDTRWVMWATLIGAYIGFQPMAAFLALVYPGGPLWAWIGAAIYLIFLSMVLFRRFQSERWKGIQIFRSPTSDGGGAEAALPAVALQPVRQPVE